MTAHHRLNNYYRLLFRPRIIHLSKYLNSISRPSPFNNGVKFIKKKNQSINATGRHLPLDAGEVNNNVDIALALQVAYVRLLNGHGPLEEVLAPKCQLLNNVNLEILS